MTSPDPRLLSSDPRIHPTAELKGVKLGRFASVAERVILRDVTVGDFSYFERHGEAIHADIGKFCSIAANARINALEHPLERLTTHKLSYRPNEYFRFQGVDQEFRARRAGKRVVIGNDVWIGHGAVILPGVAIGDGAVVGANSVVTRPVAPFTIVAGAPARVLRRRFSHDISDRILRLSWWDWPPERLFDAVGDMQRLAIEAFLDKWEGLSPDVATALDVKANG